MGFVGFSSKPSLLWGFSIDCCLVWSGVLYSEFGEVIWLLSFCY